MKILDMNGVEIEIGDKVKRHALIGKKSELAKERTVDAIQPMHAGGELMIWFREGGGAHHPQACEVIQ